MNKPFCLLALLACVAACAPSPAPVPPAVPGTDPFTGQPVDVTPGLNDVEPDVCNSAPYRGLIGLPATAVSSAGITAPTRVIPAGGLITEEYSSSRINFYLDAAGMIEKITCG